MWRILLEEFVGDLRAQRTRALLTCAAVAWGTLCTLLLLAFGEGLRRAVLEGQLSAADRIFIVRGGVTSRPFAGLPPGRAVRLADGDLPLLRRAVPALGFGAIWYNRGQVAYRSADSTIITSLDGVDIDHDVMRHMQVQRGGRFITAADLARKRRVVVLGPTLARRLFPGRASAVGEVLRIDGAAFTVVGVMRPKFQTSWDDAMDADRGVIPHATFRALYGPRTVDGLLVRPTDLARAPAAKQAIYATLGRRYQFDPRDERALDINDAIEDARITEMIGLGIKSFLTLVGVLTLLVAGVGVGNIMFVVVKERTPEIGVKRALGARRPHIMAQFLLEAVGITLAGGMLGVLVSVAIVAGTNAVPIPAGDMTLTFLLRPVLSTTAIWVAVASLVAIGGAAGWLPARRAATVDPVEALRYE